MDNSSIATPVGLIGLFLYFTIKEFFDFRIEEAKTKLEIDKHQAETRFSKLHEKQFTLLSNLFSDYFNLELALLKLTTPFQGPEWSDDANAVESVQKHHECRKLLDSGMIFISEDLYLQLDASLELCKEIIIDMKKAHWRDRTDISIGEAHDLWQKAFEKVTTSVVENRKSLASSIRSHFGVEVVSTSNSVN